VADQPAGDADDPAPQGGDHGFASADAVARQDDLAAGDGGELVQPGGHAGGQQRAPHPSGIDLGISAGKVPQRGAVLAVAEEVLDAGAVPVPVLGGGGLIRRGDVQVGQDEGIGVDRAGLGELGDGQGALVGVQGAAAATGGRWTPARGPA
jgi:hypothetical protein